MQHGLGNQTKEFGSAAVWYSTLMVLFWIRVLAFVQVVGGVHLAAAQAFPAGGGVQPANGVIVLRSSLRISFRCSFQIAVPARHELRASPNRCFSSEA